jgi:hypothetical protein
MVALQAPFNPNDKFKTLPKQSQTWSQSKWIDIFMTRNTLVTWDQQSIAALLSHFFHQKWTPDVRNKILLQARMLLH